LIFIFINLSCCYFWKTWSSSCKSRKQNCSN